MGNFVVKDEAFSTKRKPDIICKFIDPDKLDLDEEVINIAKPSQIARVLRGDKERWILYSIVLSFIALGLFIYHFFIFKPPTRIIERKNQQLDYFQPEVQKVTYPKEIEQVGLVLRYLLERSKQYDELLLGIEHKEPKIKADEVKTINFKHKMPFLIANVIVEKANLRPEPDIKSKPFLTISKDAKLLVEERASKWTKVIAPNGKLAWISNDIIEISGAG